MRLAEPIAFTSLFPYIYFMVKDFHVAKHDNEISKYAGYLATCFAFAQVCCGMQWAKAADRYGRKRIMLCGLTGTAASMLLLGFSSSYYMALLARTLMGCINGNVAIVRTVLGEIAVERKHQALSVVMMPLSWAIGSVIGPFIGGYLTYGGEDKPNGINAGDGSWLDRLYSAYPYAFVNIIISGFLLTSCALTFFFLEETHFLRKYQYDVGLDLGDRFLKKIKVYDENKQRYWKLGSTATDHDEEAAVELLTDLDGTPEPTTNPRDQTSSSKQESIPWKTILNPNLINILIISFFQGLQEIVFREFLPIFLSSSLLLDSNGDLLSKFPFHIVGGLGFSSKQTGALFSVSGLLGVFVVMVIFPYVDRTFNTMPILRLFLAVMPICNLCVPFVIFLVPNGKSNNFQSYIWVNLALYAIELLRNTSSSNVKPQLMLIVHRGAPAKFKAVVNSLVVTVNTASRAVGPLVWGYVYTFAQKREIGWLSWWLLCLFAVVTVIQSWIVDIEEEEEEEEEDVEE